MDNKAIVQSFLDTLWNKRDVAKASELTSEDYVGHNSLMAVPTRDGFIAACTAMLEAFPEPSVRFHLAVAQDDLVAVLVHFRTSAEDPGSASMDFFRLRDGKIIESWDMVQPLSDLPTGMF